MSGAYVLAILYTLGYLSMMGALMVLNIPENNRELLLTLVGIMSAAQLGIIKFYYDGSQGAQAAQVANIARSAKNETALQEIAKVAATSTPPVLNDPVPPEAGK